MKARAKALGLKGVRINTAGCLDRCEHGPSVVIYPEGVWYTVRSEADVDEILAAHLRDGRPVARLLMPEETK
jgi:(2Fe-2S) ferredoxin